MPPEDMATRSARHRKRRAFFCRRALHAARFECGPTTAEGKVTSATQGQCLQDLGTGLGLAARAQGRAEFRQG